MPEAGPAPTGRATSSSDSSEPAPVGRATPSEPSAQTDPGEPKLDRVIGLLGALTLELVALQTPDGVYTYVSPAARDLLGYEPEALVGKSAFALFHPEDLLSLMRIRAAAPDPHAPWTHRHRLRRADGAFASFETAAAPLPDGLVLVVTHPTAWREPPARAPDAPAPPGAPPATSGPGPADRALASAPDGLFALDRELRVTLWNDAMARLTQRNPEAARGRGALEALPSLAGTDAEKVLRAALNGREGSVRLTIEGRALEMRCAPLPDGAGVVATLRDAPPAAPAAPPAPRLRSFADLQARILAAASQELRADIAAVRATASAPPKPNTGAALLNRADHLHALADALVTVGDMQSRASTFDPTPVDLSLVLRSAAVDSGGHVKLSAIEGLRVMGDSHGLLTALADLFRGLASKEAPLEVDAHRAGAFIALRLRGRALPRKEALAKRFEPFAALAQDRRARDFALFPALVAIKAHGGDLDAFEDSDGSTVLVVRLPAA